MMTAMTNDNSNTYTCYDNMPIFALTMCSINQQPFSLLVEGQSFHLEEDETRRPLIGAPTSYRLHESRIDLRSL